VRTRSEFVKRGVVAAILDAPSDRQSGFGMRRRISLQRKTFADISAVVDDLCSVFPGLPLFLIVQAAVRSPLAALAVSSANRIAGVVLTSTSFQETGMRAKDPGPGLKPVQL